MQFSSALEAEMVALLGQHRPHKLRGYKIVRQLNSRMDLMHPDGRVVLYSVSPEADGQAWIHVSLSRPNRMPSYEDLRITKEHLLGPGRVAYQVFPSADKHVNFHPYCLHLWSPCERDPLPDFRTNGMI